MKQFLFALLIAGMCASTAQGQEKIVMKEWPNGKPSFVVYFKGKGAKRQKIREISYHENGKTDYEGGFKNGREHGKWTYFYENGNLMYEEWYREGLEEGKHIEYGPDGQVRKTEYYKAGKLIRTE